jgi:hypothetical protein
MSFTAFGIGHTKVIELIAAIGHNKLIELIVAFGHNELIKLIAAFRHIEVMELIDNLVGNHKLIKLIDNLIGNHELIELINGLIRHDELIKLINCSNSAITMRNYVNVMLQIIVALCSEGAQPAPTILRDNPLLHRLIVDLIPTLHSEGAQAS